MSYSRSIRLCCYLLLSLPLHVVAQGQHYLDSLNAVIHSSKNQKDVADALNGYAYEFRRGNLDSGMIYTERARNLSEKIHYYTGVGDYYECVGSFLFNDNPDTTISLFHRAIAAYARDNNQERIIRLYGSMSNAFIATNRYDSAMHYSRWAVAAIYADKKNSYAEKERLCIWLYQSIGNIFYYMSYYDSSIIYSEKGLKIAERNNMPDAEANCLNTIANVHAQQKEYKQAVHFTELAAAIDKKTGSKQGYILCLTNIASHLTDAGDYAGAKRYADSAVSEGVRYNYKKHLSHNFQTYGDICMHQKRYKEALTFYLAGLDSCKKYPNDFVEYSLVRNVGEAYLENKEPAKAKPYFLKAVNMSEDDREAKQLCYAGLAEAYGQLNDYKEAFKYAQLSAVLKDSIFTEQTKETINETSIKYETQRKEQQIKLLSKENELQTLRAQKSEQQKYFFIFAFSVLCVSGPYVFYKYRKQKRHENEQALLKERLSIGRDLHDDMGATLSSISVYSTAVKQRIQDGKIEEAEKLLDIVSEDAQEMVTNMSDMVWLVKPDNNTLGRLFDRVQLLASNVLTARNIKFEFRMDDVLKGVSLHIEAKKNIFLIAKEAVNNAMKYSGCAKISIVVHDVHDVLHVTITDDGDGFDLERHHEGNGLKNMTARAEELKGNICMKSEQGKGTEIEFSCKLPIIRE